MISAEGGSTIVAGIKQYNPNCDLLSGFRKEECQQNRENAGLSGVSWWAWLVLGVVLSLILVVVVRMLCASYRDGRQQQQHNTKTVRHKHRTAHHHQHQHHQQQRQQEYEQQQGEEEGLPPQHPVVGLVTIPEYPGGVESYHDQQGYVQYPHYYYPHYLHYPPYTEGIEGVEGVHGVHGVDGQEGEEGATAVPYAHVRYANSDTVYTV